MKRVLGLILALSSLGFVVSADAKTTSATNENSMFQDLHDESCSS